MARLLGHYVHTARAATMLFDPAQEPIEADALRPGTVVDPPAKYQEALDWFLAERPALLAAVRHSADGGFDSAAWQLAFTLFIFLDWQGYWHDLEAVGRAAVAAARRSTAPALARAHRHVSVAYLGLSRFDDAETELLKALEVSVDTGDRVEQAFAYNSLAALEDRQNHPDQAIPHARRSLELFEAAGHRIGQAVALSSVGWYQALLGELPDSLVSCRRALDLLEELGDRYGQAHAWDSLGYANHRLGRHGEAVDCYRQAVAIFTEVGDRYQEADTTGKLGDVLLAMGDLGAARPAWQHALTIFTELNHPHAEALRSKLEPGFALPQTG
jgi:tetratricopeptide (TPR) repeat protein